MEKESSENDVSANGEAAESSPAMDEEKQEGQRSDFTEQIKQEPIEQNSEEDRTDGENNTKTLETVEENVESNDVKREGMEASPGNNQDQKSNKQSSVKKLSSSKLTSNVKNGDCTPPATKEKESTNEKMLIATSQPSPVVQASANRSGINAVNTRSTRSQNPEFLARQRNFLHKVHLASHTKTEEDMLVDDDNENSATQGSFPRTSGSVHLEETSGQDSIARRKRERSASNGNMSPTNVPSAANGAGNSSGSNSPALTQQQIKKRRTTRTDSSGAQILPVTPSASPVTDISVDRFCWVCHKDSVAISCVTCPRVYHLRCVQLDAAPTVDWVCPECSTILQAENFDTRSRAMRQLSLEQLCTLLKFAVARMKSTTGAEPFCKAVDVVEFSFYRNYVAHPMDLSLMERNIKKRMYGSTEAFIADTKWILHNCIIFNTYQSRLTGVAKQLVKICKQEMSEIENCPDCYLYAHTRKDSWFIEVCRKPHILVWAKLKGFPFWPAKVMRTNKDGMVDVRFFGAHDRAWVPTRECFLYSKTMPASARNKKRNNLEACIEEVEQHTKKLRDRFGAFEHASFRTNFDPLKAIEQLQLLLPKYNPNDEGGPTSAKRARLSGGYASRRSLAIAQDCIKVEEQIAASEKQAGNHLKEQIKSMEQVASRDAESSEEDSRQDSTQKRASRESSVCSEESQESDADAVLKDRKSASLIEWSRFEESAAKLTTGEEEEDDEEDKQSSSFDDPKKDESSNSSIGDLPEMTGAEHSSSEKSEEERKTAFELETSEVVKKVAEGLTKVAIADKLQEKLLLMEKNLQLVENENEDCETSAQDKEEEIDEHKTDNDDDDIKKTFADSANNERIETENTQKSGDGEKVADIDNGKGVSPTLNTDTTISESAAGEKQATEKGILFNVDNNELPEEEKADELPEEADKMSFKEPEESTAQASETVMDKKENEESSRSSNSSSSADNEIKAAEPAADSMKGVVSSSKTEKPLDSNKTEKLLGSSETEMFVGSSETERVDSPKDEQQNGCAEKEIESNEQPSNANSEIEESLLPGNKNDREAKTSVCDENDVSGGNIDIVLKKEVEEMDDTIVDSEINKEKLTKNDSIAANCDKIENETLNESSEKTVTTELPNQVHIGENPGSEVSERALSPLIASNNENIEERKSEETTTTSSQQFTEVPSASESTIEQHSETTNSLVQKSDNDKEANSSITSMDKSADGNSDTLNTTDTPESGANVKNKTTDKESGTELLRPIKEEPVDPDEVTGDASGTKVAEHSIDNTLTETRQFNSAAEKEKLLTSKNVNLSSEDKDRQAANESPALSDKDGIFPSLFLDPSITITVVNDKQSETSEVPTVSKSTNSSSEINVNNLRASVNLSKDISLTVVGADYGGHISSGKEIMGLDMECDHASDHDSCDSPQNSAPAAATSSSSLMSLTVQNSPSSILGQNVVKKTKKKANTSADSLQARSRARKSFPNKPILPSVKVKSQPELMNGTTGFGNKPNTLSRRNSVSGSDSRLNSCGPLSHHDIMPPQQHGSQMQAEGRTVGDSNSIIMAPPMLGNNLPQNSTNHIQALRAVNGNIGAPSTHLVNGNSEANVPPRIMAQQGTSGPRISPATGNNARMPPQLQPRPSGPLLSQHPPAIPPEAGQVTAELNRHSQKISDCVRAALEDMLRDLSTLGNPQATIKSLQLELERQQWLHKQELAEMKHNADLLVMEMRASMEGESQRILNETIQRCELEKQRAVEETKKKQWCTNCGKEALFYCCWNTSYCDYPCQQHHWPQHMSSCAQNQPVENRDGSELGQQNNPKQSGRGMNQNKSIVSQQQPWFDSSSLYNSATSSAGNTSPLTSQRNNSQSPSPLVIDEDYDNNNNSNNFETLSQERNVTKKRKRCGECAGCTRVGKCGVCPPCKSIRTHQVCRQRRCSNLLEEGSVRRSGLVQQKQSGKFIGGPPLSYSGPTQIPPQRNRMPNQYLGPRGNNMQNQPFLPTYAMFPGDPRGGGLVPMQPQRLMGSQFPPRHHPPPHPHMGFTIRPPHYFL